MFRFEHDRWSPISEGLTDFWPVAFTARLATAAFGSTSSNAGEFADADPASLQGLVGPASDRRQGGHSLAGLLSLG